MALNNHTEMDTTPDLVAINPISFQYQNMNIDMSDINTFLQSNRSHNDKFNKTREAIISAVINDKVPMYFYYHTQEWASLRTHITFYLRKLTQDNSLELTNCACVIKAGRNYHYDFDIMYQGKTYHVEFKFNVSMVVETPQFVSPMRPSQYLDASFESFYYDNYLPILLEGTGINIPSREVYLSNIHKPSPPCVSAIQEKYYGGCRKSSKYTGSPEDIAFYEKAKNVSKQCIQDFITLYGLKIAELNQYLVETQKDKYYMLYKDGLFHLETVNLDNYKIVSYQKEPQLQRYVAQTMTGVKMKILLRWKNGNGIAYPAFQIS